MKHEPMSQLDGINELPDHDKNLARTGQSPPADTEMLMREIINLQAQVARLYMVIDRGAAGPAVASGPPGHLIRGIRKARSERSNFFAPELFSDPAWDMLLELYAAQLAQVRVPVTSLCVASNAPMSTALRWISALQRKGLIERRADPLDGRRLFLSLTAEGSDALDQYFASLKGITVI